MTDEIKSAPMRAAERACKQVVRDQQASRRERDASESEAATEAKIARLKEQRLARDTDAKNG